MREILNTIQMFLVRKANGEKFQEEEALMYLEMCRYVRETLKKKNDRVGGT